MWNQPTSTIPSGLITADLGGEYRQAYIEYIAGHALIHIEQGPAFSWAMVKQWAHVPGDCYRTERGAIVYREH